MFCSPTGKKLLQKVDGGVKSCLTSAALMRIIDAYNATHPTVRISKGGGKAAMWSAINERMLQKCGQAAEHCWVDSIPGAAGSKEVEKLFMPATPKAWKTNEYTWLTNFDIEKGLMLYDAEPSYHYKFLGVFPIDFAKATFGGCLYQEMCNIDFAKMLKKKVRYMGAVLNTDPQDAPGQHWISLFMVIDPAHKAYGAYFFDSVGDAPPKEVKEFMYKMREAAAKVSPRKFRLAFSQKKMQFRNTECGIFSIAYQIRWLNLLNSTTLGAANVDFRDIIDQNIDDSIIHELRKVLFRPGPA